MCVMLLGFFVLYISASETNKGQINNQNLKRSYGSCRCGKQILLCKCGCHPGTYSKEYIHKCCKPCLKPGKCFPGDATVLLDTGKSVQMKNLAVGQRILTVQNGKRVFSEVRTFLHRQPEQNTTFFTMITEQGHQLSLSEFHVIFTSANKSANMEPSFAKSVKLGDYIFTTAKCPDDLCSERIVRIVLSIKQGLYAPLTNTGTVVVNKIVTSCFVNFLKHDITQIILLPFRWFPSLILPWQEDGLSPLLSNMEYILSYYYFQFT